MTSGAILDGEWRKCGLFYAAICALLSISASKKADAQITGATILGRVPDHSGAPITGTKTTDSKGEYLIPSLPIAGNYEGGIEVPNFEKFGCSRITRQVNENTRADSQLQVCPITHKSESPAAILVDRHTFSLSEVVEQSVIRSFRSTAQSHSACRHRKPVVTIILPFGG